MWVYYFISITINGSNVVYFPDHLAALATWWIYIYHPISNSVKVCQYSLYLSQDECISVQNCLSITNKLSEAALYKCLSKGLYRIYQYRNHVSICIPKQQQPKEIYVQKPVKL